jgi:hypothetical protein
VPSAHRARGTVLTVEISEVKIKTAEVTKGIPVGHLQKERHYYLNRLRRNIIVYHFQNDGGKEEEQLVYCPVQDIPSGKK